jgi:Uma2 family endonuclease
MAVSQPKSDERRGKVSYEEFLRVCDEDTLAEWVDGEVVMTSPASNRHQAITDFLLKVLGVYVEQRDLGRVISAPFQMKTGPTLAGREPDVLFITQQNLVRLKDTYLEGPADLVVEVVSPESRLRDRGEKMAEYELGRVQEYWIVDPDKRQADFYVLGDDGRYERRKPDAQGIYRSAVVPGFWVDEQWLWNDPPPKTLSVLRQLGVV